MTPEQETKLKAIAKQLSLLFPGFFGNIQFNLNPKAEDHNVQVNQNKKWSKR